MLYKYEVRGTKYEVKAFLSFGEEDFSCAFFHFEVPLPDGVDWGIDHKFQDEAGDDTAYHRGGDALH